MNDEDVYLSVQQITRLASLCEEQSLDHGVTVSTLSTSGMHRLVLSVEGTSYRGSRGSSSGEWLIAEDGTVLSARGPAVEEENAEAA